MHKWLIVVVFSLASGFASRTDEATARRILSAGYTDVRATGFDFGCGKNALSATGFVAKDPAGRTVSGVVCCEALLKSCEVKF